MHGLFANASRRASDDKDFVDHLAFEAIIFDNL